MASVWTRAIKLPGRVNFSTTAVVNAKFQKSFDTCLGAHGPLIDGADYTFLDGRPTPLNSGQRRRAKEQIEASERVLQLMKETKFAIEWQKRRQVEASQKRQNILDSKLKPKKSKTLSS